MLEIKGKGNPEWGFSAQQGAGRLMSRTRTRNTLSIDVINESVDVIEEIKPIYYYKAN